MNEKSGRWGAVNGISTVRNWAINDAHTAPTAVASNTGFGTARRVGVQDWTGSFDVYGTTPPIYPGDLFAFIGYMGPDDNVSGVGPRYAGDARCNQLTMNMNWAGGEIISLACEFGGHLALTPTSSGGAEITDGTVPALTPISGGSYIEYSLDGSTWHVWESLLQATWTWTNAVQPYVNSSTFVSGKLWTGRAEGHNDWSLQCVEQNTNRARFAKGQELWIRLHLDSSGTNFWELKTGLVGQFTGIQVDRETSKIIQQTINVDMNANGVSDGSLGWIKNPAGVVVWGDGLIS